MERSSGIEFACKSVSKTLDIPNLSRACLACASAAVCATVGGAPESTMTDMLKACHARDFSMTGCTTVSFVQSAGAACRAAQLLHTGTAILVSTAPCSCMHRPSPPRPLMGAAAKQAQHLDNVKREIKILTRLRGTLSVVHFKGAYEDDQHIHLVMELCRRVVGAVGAGAGLGAAGYEPAS